MEPLNKADRKKSFTNFFLLFLLCVAILTTTIFFSTQIPFRQNDRLIKEMRAFVKEKEFSQEFMTEMTEIAGMLDTINTKASKPDLLDGRITEYINKLNLKIGPDSAGERKFYKNVVFVLSDFQTAKKQLREITGKDLDVSEVRKQVESLNATLSLCKDENLKLKQQVFMLQQNKQ